MDEVTDFEAREFVPGKFWLVTGMIGGQKIGGIVSPEAAEDEAFCKSYLYDLQKEYL